jgi:hypothetical protein
MSCSRESCKKRCQKPQNSKHRNRMGVALSLIVVQATIWRNDKISRFHGIEEKTMDI